MLCAWLRQGSTVLRASMAAPRITPEMQTMGEIHRTVLSTLCLQVIRISKLFSLNGLYILLVNEVRLLFSFFGFGFDK